MARLLYSIYMRVEMRKDSCSILLVEGYALASRSIVRSKTATKEAKQYWGARIPGQRNSMERAIYPQIQQKISSHHGQKLSLGTVTAAYIKETGRIPFLIKIQNYISKEQQSPDHTSNGSKTTMISKELIRLWWQGPQQVALQPISGQTIWWAWSVNPEMCYPSLTHQCWSTSQPTAMESIIWIDLSLIISNWQTSRRRLL